MNTSAVVMIALALSSACATAPEPLPIPSDEVSGVELVLTPDNCTSTEPNVQVTVSDAFLPAGSSFFVDDFKLYQDDRVRAEMWEDGKGGLLAVLGPPGGLCFVYLGIHIRREGDRILVTPHMLFPNDLDEGDPPVIDNLRGSIRLAAGTWKVGGPVLFDVNLVGGDETTFLARGEARGGVPDYETWMLNRDSKP